MISIDKQPKWTTTSDEDFTRAHYRQLLCAAKDAYQFATYDSVPWGTRFILWRHDLDFSINRAADLARIESEEGVISTYFVNPHSEFYNPFDVHQAQLIKYILGLGHRLGLHFDASFHNIQSEEQLNCKVAHEASWLEESFESGVDAFSFHNPGPKDLQYSADHYGSLINCYSHRFKSDVPYCSDSNGYWRFRRLHDVLTEAKDPCLQVLTHPGWWQDKPMPPRQRIVRSAYGRAASTMHKYDEELLLNGRLNHSINTHIINLLKNDMPDFVQLFDVLWNVGAYDSLFTELWSLFEKQLNRLCIAVLRKEWLVSAPDVSDFLNQDAKCIDGSTLFRGLFGDSWMSYLGIEEDIHAKWLVIRSQLNYGKEGFSSELLKEGCIYIIQVITCVSDWGLLQPFCYNGLANLDSIGLISCKTAGGDPFDHCDHITDESLSSSIQRWASFKLFIAENTSAVCDEADNCA